MKIVWNREAETIKWLNPRRKRECAWRREEKKRWGGQERPEGEDEGEFVFPVLQFKLWNQGTEGDDGEGKKEGLSFQRLSSGPVGCLPPTGNSHPISGSN